MSNALVWPASYLIPGIKPFHQEDAGIIYCADCRDILPHLPKVDLVLTDPPYPDIKKSFQITEIDVLDKIDCLQLIFWSAMEPFPLNYTAIHIWHKPNGNSSQHYERIFERKGQKTCRVYRVSAILPNYFQYKHECVEHPTQKPLKLIKQLLRKHQIILDPFLGSGTTAVAAKELGRKFIGIEISEEYCRIAVKRLRQGVLNFGD